MLKKLIKISFVFFLIFEVYYFLTNSILWKETFITITKLWLYKVVVSIVPMYILSSLLLCLPFVSKICFKIIRPLKLFENQKALSLFGISFLTGSPTIAILVKKAYLNKEISYKQASDIINSSSHVSFLFIILIFEKYLAIIIILSQVITTFILYLTKKRQIPNYTTYSNNNIFDNINDIIDDLPLILLKILVTMIIVVLIKLPFASLNNLYLKLPLDFLEVTTGINNFINYDINILFKIFLCSFLLSLNGAAILLQVFNTIKKTSLSFPKYFKGRIIHALISSVLSLGFYFLFIFFF